MKKQLFLFLTAGFCMTLLHQQVLQAQSEKNTATGYEALFSITTGTYNTATGYKALRSNTEGHYNSAHGAQSLNSNTTGTRNTATGYEALYKNTTGSSNTANGDAALYSNTTGFFNTAIGSGALFFNTTGSMNIASGFNALASNTAGFNNSGLGSSALYSNTTGTRNTATGYQALYNNTTGIDNTANGSEALYSNIIGSANIAIGNKALFFNTGNNNSAIGYSALYNNTTGANNTATGSSALLANKTGNNNAAFGVRAGDSFNPFNSTFIGVNSDASKNVNNSTALGFGAIVTASNQVRIGNANVNSIGGQVSWTAFSDGRFKKNLKDDVPGLEFINQLHPLTYTLDVEGIENKLKASSPKPANSSNRDEMNASFNEPPSAEEKQAQQEKARIKYTGFVAQQVEEAAKKVNYEFSGVDAPKDKEGFYGLRYAEFVVPLVKAVQELSKKNEELSKKAEKVEELEARLARLEALIASGTINNTGSVNNTAVNLTGSYLEQNAPNPFSSATIIRYHIATSVIHAKVEIKDMKGALIKSVALNSKGSGQITLHAGALSAGTYTYTLWTDNQQADTKKLMIMR